MNIYDIRTFLKKFGNSPNPDACLAKANKRRLKSGQGPLPLEVSTDQQAISKFNDEFSIELEIFVNHGLSKKQIIQNATTEEKHKFFIKEEKKKEASRVAAGKRSTYIANKAKSKRDPKHSPSTFVDLSFQGMERYSNIKKEQELRKLLKKDTFINVSDGSILSPGEKVRSSGFTKSESQVFRQEKNYIKKQKKKERQQRRSGNIKSESGLLEDIDFDLLEHLPDPIKSVFQKQGRVWIVFVYQIYRSKAIADYLAASHQMAMLLGLDDTDAVERAFSSFLNAHWSAFQSWKDGVRSESGTVADDIAELFNATLNSDLVIALQDLIISLASMKWFSKDVAHNLFHFFGPARKMSVIEFTHVVLKSIRSLFCFSQSLKDGVPISEALFSGDPLNTAISKTHELLRNKDLVYSGLPVEGKMDIMEFNMQLKANLELIKTGLKYMSPFDKRKLDTQRLFIEGTHLLTVNLSSLQGKERKSPLGIMVYGKPGLGKSFIMPYLLKIHCAVKGRTYARNMVFPKIPTSDYWDGYDPMSNPYIHFSEAARGSRQAVQSRGDSQLDEIVSLMDTMAFPVNMAFEDKGKVFAAPELVIADTNNESLNLEFLYHCPEAFRRRFIFVEPTVLPEFLKEGTHRIDPNKALAAGGHPLDRYSFKVYRSNGVRSSEDAEILGSGLRLKEMGDLMAKLFMEHIRNEDKVSAAVDDCDVVLSDDVWDDVRAFAAPQAESGLATVAENTYQQIKGYTSMVVSDCAGFVYAYVALSLLPKAFKPQPMSFTWQRLFISYLLLVFGYKYLSFVFLLLSFCNEAYFLSPYINSKLADVRGGYKSKYYFAKAHLKYLVFKTPFNPFKNPTAPNILLLGLLISLTGFLMKNKILSFSQFVKSFFAPVLTGSSESDVVKLFSLDDERFAAGSEFSRVKLHNSAVWNVREPRSAPVHTGTAESLYARVKRNIRFVHVKTGGVVLKTHVLGVCNSFAIINTHSLGVDEIVTISISQTDGIHVDQSGWRDVVVRKDETVRITDDLSLINLMSCRFSDIRMHFGETFITGNYSGIYKGAKTRFDVFDKPITITDRFLGDVKASGITGYMDMSHRSGDCGLPLIGIYGGGSAIYSLHCAGMTGRANSFGKLVRRSEVEEAVKTLSSNVIFVVNSESALLETDLEEPSFKSMVHYEVLHNISYLGKVKGATILDSHSRLRKTRFHGEIYDFFVNHCQWYDVEPYFRPVMRPRVHNGEYQNPYNIAVRALNEKRKCLDPLIMKKVSDDLVKEILEDCANKGIKQLRPLTIEQAINGIEQDAFINRVNASTAGGFGFPGKKSVYVPLVEDSHVRLPTENLTARLNNALNMLANDKSACFVYNANLKDEPRKFDKVETAQTRVFYASSIDSLVLCRMFLTPFYTLMMSSPEVFQSAVGIDMHKGADGLYRDMVEFSTNILEGDYKNYDQKQPIGMGEMSASIIYRVLEGLGYTPEALKVARGLLSENLQCYINVLGDIFRIYGIQPSGKYCTAEDNSLRGYAMIKYYWYYRGFDKEYGNIRDFVKIRTYGDDLLGAVKPTAPKFTIKDYGQFCGDVLGMEFTASDKSKVLKDYLKPSEMSFLKRTFVYSERQQRFVAPLAHSSIVRALTWYSPSNFLSEEEQVIATCISMLWEVAIGHEKYFERFRVEILNLLNSCYDVPRDVLHRSLPTYDKITLKVFGDPREEEFTENGDLSNPSDRNSTPSRLDDFLGIGIDGKRCQITTECAVESNRIQNTRLTDDSYKKEKKEAELLIAEMSRNLAVTLFEVTEEEALIKEKILAHPQYSYLQGLRGKKHEVVRNVALSKDLRTLLCTYEDLRHTREVLKRKDFGFILTESGMVTTEPQEYKSVEGNFQDLMGAEKNMQSAGDSMQPYVGQEVSLTPDEFFERPVEIATFSIITGGDFLNSYEIWDSWSNQPSIRAKLRNFAYFSGDIHVRINVSATPFHYGRLLLSYQPYASINTALTTLETAVGTYPTMRPLLINFLSQADGSVSMDVKTNQPVEIKCPFISPKPMFRLFNNSASVISDVTPFEDFEEAGRLYIGTINPVESINATTTDVTVQIYAWATNVQLGTVTATQMAITTESGVVDERETGPVEKIASNVASISKKLEDVPYIGPVAQASNMVASGIGKIASLFGWSRPAIMSEPTLVKNQPYQNGAMTIGSETTYRIVLDPKQQLNVTPAQAGTMDDEMSITSISSRYSYLTTFDWQPLAADMESLWTCRVHPRLETIDTTAASNYYHQPTAMAFAVTPFVYWNGSITYRFEAVCSSFHRGKFLIYYEPNLAQASLIDADLSTNKQHLAVIDLQDTQVVEVTVNWACARQWITTEQFPRNQYGSTMSVTNPWYSNGYIGVSSFTSLQSPDSSTIPINVYVKSEDLAVNQLSQREIPSERVIRSESGVVSVEDPISVQLNDGISLSDASVHHFGERPVSFRALLKRYVTTAVYNGSGTVLVATRLTEPVFPENNLPFGSSAPVNTNTLDLFSYLRYAYLGAKGGLRKRIHLTGDWDINPLTQVKVSLNTPAGGYTAGLVLSSLVANDATINGTVTFMPHSNGGIEFEVPFYSANLFYFPFADDLTGGMSGDEFIAYWTKAVTVRIDGAGTFTDLNVEVETASGEDFGMLRYQGAPYYTEPK